MCKHGKFEEVAQQCTDLYNTFNTLKTFLWDTDELGFNNAQIYTKTFNSCAFN